MQTRIAEVIKGLGINVTGLKITEDGERMILEGMVRTYYQKQMVQEAARRVTSQVIENNIVVDYEPATELIYVA